MECASMRVASLQFGSKSSPFVGSKWASEMPAAKTDPQPVICESIVVGNDLANGAERA